MRQQKLFLIDKPLKEVSVLWLKGWLRLKRLKYLTSGSLDRFTILKTIYTDRRLDDRIVGKVWLSDFSSYAMEYGDYSSYFKMEGLFN